MSMRRMTKPEKVLVEALLDIANSYHCGTEGCSADEPMCYGSEARAAINRFDEMRRRSHGRVRVL